tara:strand:- start:485 stop:793 length:309 start_codon:yes stop_codon:yes gene_type:complete
MTVNEASTQEQTRFEKDWFQPMNINGMESNKGYYNLIVSIRDVSLWIKGLKPHRNWYLTDVKKYFGIKGNAQTVLDILNHHKEYIHDTMEADLENEEDSRNS